MGNTKHEKSFVDFDKPYEQNIVGLRGVIYFAVGLFLLVVITFGLMWLLLNVFEEQSLDTDNAERNPMQLSEKDSLPPEPRLQGAPGFGVDTKDGRVNLELRNPQAEWETIQEVNKDLWENGRKIKNEDGTDTFTVLPIEQAKERILEQSEKTETSAAQGQNNILEESRMFMSDSNAGRLATEKRR
ncbi:MAG: hypothetical protein ABIP06_08420 [Pyrinomonadaceae bacterium]